MALAEARTAGEVGEVPVGAVLVDREGTILARAGNNCVGASDPAGHAEMRVLRRACRQAGNYRLPGTTLYVTLEPCPMCAAAMIQARVERVVFGAEDPKSGALVSVYRIGRDGLLNHRFQVRGGVLAGEAAALLRNFFQKRR